MALSEYKSKYEEEEKVLHQLQTFLSVFYCKGWMFYSKLSKEEEEEEAESMRPVLVIAE